MKSAALFDKIAEKIASSPSATSPIAGVYQYNIKADDGTHTFIMDLKNSKTGSSTSEKVDVTFDISDDDFVMIHSKKLSQKDAIAQGKMTVSGNLELAEKLFAASAASK